MSRKKKKTSKDDFIAMVFLFISGIVYLISDSLSYGIVTFVFLVVLLTLYYIYKLNINEKRLSRSGIRDIDQMDGFQFEHYLVALFRKHGYKAKRTPSSNDYGADLLLEGKERIVIQAKRYKSKVGIKAVQEIVSAREYYKAEQAWVVTNNFFTSQAIKLAQSTSVRLINRDQLQNLILNINPDVTAKKIRETVEPEPVRCKECGSPMVRRYGGNGDFFGCSQYPKCHYKRPIAR